MLRQFEEADQILFQQVICFIALIFIVFVESALGHIASFFGAAPKLTICLIFILTIKFRYAVTLISAVVAGLVFDLTQGNPLGYTSSIFLAVYSVAGWRHVALVDADAGKIWSEFVLVIFGVMIYSLLVFGLYEGRIPPFAEVTFQIGLTVLIFPVINWIFDLYRNIGLYFGGSR